MSLIESREFRVIGQEFEGKCLWQGKPFHVGTNIGHSWRGAQGGVSLLSILSKTEQRRKFHFSWRSF